MRVEARRESGEEKGDTSTGAIMFVMVDMDIGVIKIIRITRGSLCIIDTR